MKQQPRQETVLEGLPIGSKAQRQATAADDHGDGDFLDILLGVQFISKRPDILKYLNERDRAVINKRGSICVFNPGEHLFRQADHHSGIFIIESGLVKVYYSSPAGKQATLAFWDAGNFVGGPDVFGTFDHIWSGIAVRRTSTVFISGNDLRALATELPGLAMGLIEALSYKGRCYSIFGQLLATRTALERLAILLCYLGSHHGRLTVDGGMIVPPFTQEDLASLIGTTRQWITAALRRFEQEGLLSSRRGRIVVYKKLAMIGAASRA